MDSGTLYIVPTPIGNLKDITLRALETLQAVDFVAAEDTRVTLKLLNHFEIKKPLVSYHKHNQSYRSQELVARLCAGESCALCTDAGTPCISDPGGELVARCNENGVRVVALPGACAAITALSASGMDSVRFCFEGFLSTNKASRRDRLLELKVETRTMIFHEAPHKLERTLADLLEAFGDREITVAREITKLHEQYIHTSLSQALASCSEQTPRGEYVLIVCGAPEREKTDEPTDPRALLLQLTEQGLSTGDACRRAAELTGMKKNELYSILIDMHSER